ncbi:N-acetyltransferase [Rhodobacteraceae bacterium CCMM004]|nr:N-acetyltransferase [Rhodobacteraceae bacterium CCMM004]
MTDAIVTDRLILRRPEARDLDAWTAFFMSPRARFVGGGATTGPGRAWRAFASIIGHWDLRGWGIRVIEDRARGTPLGGVGPFYPADWPEPEMSWTLWSAEAEGRGVAQEAAARMLTHARDDLGWTTAVSYIDPENGRSAALARRLGARIDHDALGPDGDPVEVWRHPLTRKATA